MYKGELEGFPKEVVDWMVKQQVLQGNKPDVTVFEKDKESIKREGGFNWSNTEKGKEVSIDDDGEEQETVVNVEFCAQVIRNKNFKLFFDTYPKSEYPKIMWVDDAPLSEKNKGTQRVVFMEKAGKYLAWNIAETFAEAENETETCAWKFAKDIKPEDPAELELLQKAEELIQKASELLAAANELKEAANKL